MAVQKPSQEPQSTKLARTGNVQHTNLPWHIYVWVNNKYLGPKMPEGYTYGLWHGIHSREGQIPMAHVLLESGAHWSGLPLHAMSNFHGPEEWEEKPWRDLCPWSAMGPDIQAWGSEYLEGLEVECFRNGWKGIHTGIIIDWEKGFNRYPQEHKPLNLISLEDGQFALQPNNYCKFRDDHFIKEEYFEQTKNYRRGEEVWWGA